MDLTQKAMQAVHFLKVPQTSNTLLFYSLASSYGEFIQLH